MRWVLWGCLMALQPCGAEAGDASRIARLAECAAAEARGLESSTTPGRREAGARRVGALVRAARRAAEADGVDRETAEAVLARAMNGVVTRSLTLDPPGGAPATMPGGCPAVPGGRGDVPGETRR